ncbi:hypothetical protein [Escherichia coli]|nr:hypothetical protein [Escherichia coli]
MDRVTENKPLESGVTAGTHVLQKLSFYNIDERMAELKSSMTHT